MRKAAERVDAQMQVYRRAHGVAEIWPIAERLLVGIGPAPSSQRLVRATKRMADRMGAEWTAVFVETPEASHWSEADRARVWETLALAERLGAHTVTISGPDAGTEILEYARTHNAGRIIVGKPTHPRWRDRLFGSKVEEVIRGSGDIDVYVITGEEAPAEGPRRRALHLRSRSPTSAYASATLLVGVTTALVIAARGIFEIANLAMMLLLAVVLVAARFGRGPAVFASVLAVAAFDWFTVPPYNTFRVHDTEYVVTFAVMLVVALTISTLTVRLKDQARMSRQREHRTAALYEMSRDLIETVERDEVLRAATRHIQGVFGFHPVVLLPDDAERIGVWKDELADEEPPALAAQELSVAQWVYDNARIAGAGTDTLPSAKSLYLPLRAPNGTMGVLGTGPIEPDRFRDPEQMHLLETFVNRVAAAVERWRLAEEARRIRQLEEMDRLKSEFVAQASHELRTPLTTLNLSIERLRETVPLGVPDAWARLLEAAGEDMTRLRKLVDDLLDLARMEAGRVEMRRVPVRLPGVVGSSVQAFELQAAEKGIRLACELSDDLPPVEADPERIGRVLANLVSNAVRYTEPGGRVLVTADAFGRFVQISVADNGPGIPLEDQPRVFDRFVRLKSSHEGEGSGLGLAISREIVHAHGGAIWVDSGPGPGSVFSFTLPVAEAAEPAPQPDEKAYA
jgi:two-component system sensor histidine kinase KdpD